MQILVGWSNPQEKAKPYFSSEWTCYAWCARWFLRCNLSPHLWMLKLLRTFAGIGSCSDLVSGSCIGSCWMVSNSISNLRNHCCRMNCLSVSWRWASPGTAYLRPVWSSPPHRSGRFYLFMDSCSFVLHFLEFDFVGVARLWTDPTASYRARIVFGNFAPSVFREGFLFRSPAP